MAEIKPKKVQEKKKIVFNPNANYSWNPEDEFVLTGAEYDLIYKALRANLNDPTFVAHVQQYEALKLIEEIFKAGVESEMIKEIVPPVQLNSEETEFKIGTED